MNAFANTGYYFKETFVMTKMNFLSNLLSVISTGLVFFILGMVVSGWWISTEATEVIEGDAGISVYFDKGLNEKDASKLAERIKGMDGVLDSKLIGEREAYDRMVKILGKEARVLKVFDENPFSPFIEVNIDIDKIDNVLKELKPIPGIDYIRDNRDVLDRLRSISKLFGLLGSLIIAAVGISTLVIISHIIRLGIQNNREQIGTLRLLGAPQAFIAFPFILQGLLMTLGGGIIATALAVFALNQVYARMAGPLPFLPLPPASQIMPGIAALIMIVSLVLGIAGSLIGLSSSKSS